MKLTFFTFIFVLFLIPGCGQEKEDKLNLNLKVIKKEGWIIPQYNEVELFQIGVINIQDIPVTIKEYKFKKPLDFSLELESLKGNYFKPVELRTIGSFSVNGKVYAYSTNCFTFGRAKDGSKVYLGAVITLYYLDEDGDGRFETRYMTPKFPPPVFPDWVTKTKD